MQNRAICTLQDIYQRSCKFLCGVWSDMTIEQVLMKS